MCVGFESSVLHALEYFGEGETTETRKFIGNFDRFFECLNVRSTSVEESLIFILIAVQVMQD